MSNGSLSRGVSVQGASVWGSLSRGVSVQGALCPGRSLSRGNLCPGVSVQGESLSRRGVSLSKGVSFTEIPPYGNERAVRILLECILVLIGTHFEVI